MAPQAEQMPRADGPRASDALVWYVPVEVTGAIEQVVHAERGAQLAALGELREARIGRVLRVGGLRAQSERQAEN